MTSNTVCILSGPDQGHCLGGLMKRTSPVFPGPPGCQYTVLAAAYTKPPRIPSPCPAIAPCNLPDLGRQFFIGPVDGEEVIGFQACPADQCTIDIGDTEKLFRVGRLDRT